MKKSKYDNAKIEQANIGESGEAVKVKTFEMVAKMWGALSPLIIMIF